jgi:UDP-N-acetylmuramate dehydrogenase
MIVREAVPLSLLTTLRVGGPARFVVEIRKPEEIPEALAFAREHTLPVAALGEGSNLLARDEGYEGVLLHLQVPGMEFEESDSIVRVRAGAGIAWDALVRGAARRDLWGIENLAGIPGTMGAAPVQNIGAYGTELMSTLVRVEGIDSSTGEPFIFENAECGFSYRESRFKHDPALIITQVMLELRRDGTPNLSYADLARVAEAKPLRTPEEVGEAVRAIRAKKFPDARKEGTAGSFFKNPILSIDEYRALVAQYPDLPHYPAEGKVKIPLAYVLDKVLGLRGHRKGHVRLFEAQPLVLVADAGATGEEIDTFANDIASRVHDATGIRIEREVQMLR